VLTGGYLKVLLDHRFLIRVGTNVLASSVAVPEAHANGQRARWNMGYGGLLFEYTHRSQRIVHLTGNVLLGGGYVSKNPVGRGRNWLDEEDRQRWDRSYYYAVEPGAGVEFNACKWMRVAAGESYRFIANSGTTGISDGQMSAPAGYIGFKFGWF
jgi:hypothetical protein